MKSDLMVMVDVGFPAIIAVMVFLVGVGVPIGLAARIVWAAI